MSELRTGLGLQNDPDTVMRRATAASAPSNGNVVPFAQGSGDLAPGFARDPTTGMLSRNGQSPDAMLPGGIPAWRKDSSIAAAPTDPAAMRAQTVAWWQQNGGVPLHVAQGIADQVNKESGFNPIDVGDSGTSVGLYQAHADRKESLQSRPNWQNPAVQHAWALSQVTGGDQIATQHWNEIRNASTREEASRLWQQYFERPAGTVGADHEQHISAGREELSRVGSQLSKVVEQLSKEGGRSEETWKRLREATDKMNEYQGKLLELAQKPPSPEPRDIFSRLGSLATVVGILGGALTRSPLATSLEAGAAAMDAYNKNDLLTYQFQRENWKTQIGVIEKMATFQNEQVRNVLYDERMEQGEKMNRLQALLSALGHEEQAAQAQLGDERSVRNFERQLKASTDALRERQREFDIKYGDEGGKKEKLETSKSFDIVDDKGKVLGHKMARERKDQAGFVDSETGEPIKLEPGQHLRQVTPTTSSGGRAGAQVLRQEIGAREVLSDLQNVSLLPVGTTTGPFGTYHPGTTITNALQGDLVRTLTDQDAQLMQKSMANMTRELSVLMSPVYGGNWAAQQIDPLIPKAGETLGTVLFSIARLAQTADNALEAVSKSPILSNDQQEYASQMRVEIEKAIPWTPREALEFAHRGQEKKETFGEFVKKTVSPPEIGPDQYDALPPGSPYRKPGNPQVFYKSQ